MRTTTTTRIAGASLAAAAAMALSVAPAFAADGFVSANLKPVAGNGVDGSGTAMVEVQGNKITVTMAANGLLPDNPHAAHIHFGAEARHECPVLSDDKNSDGHLNTSEGGPAYGDIVVSLTKTGDTSPKSGLAIDRFSTAPGGKIAYQRGSIMVSSDVAKAIAAGESVVVIHGVDYNKDGKYSGATKSDLDPKLPTEATDPALCGALRVAPAGGMHTGGGQAADNLKSGGQNEALLLVGGGALLAAAGSGAFAARRARSRA
jgi:Cu/Zn superoxide dismutase